MHCASSPIEHSVWTFCRGSLRHTLGLAHHSDPLVEASNWVALIIGTHLPFWPLYVWWSAGAQALPSALFTVALAPIFCFVPLLSRWNGLLGRVATLVAGVGNTVFTIWILGENSRTDLFFAPCVALAAISFRRSERWLMLFFVTLPLAVWYYLEHHPLTPIHVYGEEAAQQMVMLNVTSVIVLIVSIGWMQASIYHRMEQGYQSSNLPYPVPTK
jgi:hypothetical protein